MGDQNLHSGLPKRSNGIFNGFMMASFHPLLGANRGIATNALFLLLYTVQTVHTNGITGTHDSGHIMCFMHIFQTNG
ncbi:hypothetical protein [Salinimonas lutimaris]|uniref:hypothetical protein n=1 Tax=Salinimonas lutimaris TaxID=914153 RepID=UPI001586574D|nr:hypothetical protein [Salinimonas lutimaris]